MASGSFNISRTSGSSYLTFRVNWSSTSNGTADNTSDVTVWVYVDKSSSSTAGTYGTANTTVTVNGLSQSENGLSFSVAPSGSCLLFAKVFKGVPHNADGTKSTTISVTVGGNIMSASGSGTATLDNIPRQANITSAPNFTDEESPTIYFNNPAGGAVTVMVCISWTGAADIPYRDIVKPTDTSYTFNFTPNELNALYDATISAGSNSMTVTFYVTTVINGTRYYSTLKRTFTVVNCEPTLEPTVEDLGVASYSATGNRNILLRYFNYPKATFNSTAKKGASIVSRTVTCGNDTKNADAGDWAQFNNVSSNKFIFTIKDNRGNVVSKTVTKEMIDYVTPTCRNVITTDINTDNTANINVDILGKYYKGSLGVVDNTLTVEYRYKTINDDDFCSWVQTSGPSVVGEDYEVRVVINNLDYKGTYVIQTRAKDVIYTGGILTKEEIVKITPVFDWGENDFKFNVPVTIQGSSIQTARCFSAYTDSRHHTINFTHNQSYGLTKLPLELVGVQCGKETFTLKDGEIEITDDISLVRVYASLGINDSGCYYCITINGGYGRTPNSPVLLAPVESNIGYCTSSYVQLMNVQKGDKIGIYIGKKTAFTTTVDAAYLTIEVVI